ncbi:MAG: glycosyltransferase, partial [Planctomycetia bacterium]
MNVRVSIVVAAKEALPDLRRFVTDFLGRRPENASLVVVDGGSRDGTAEWLETVAPGGAAAGLRWLSRADSGLAEAWTLGGARADGAWSLLLGCDDPFAGPPAWRGAVETLAGLPDDCG